MQIAGATQSWSLLAIGLCPSPTLLACCWESTSVLDSTPPTLSSPNFQLLGQASPVSLHYAKTSPIMSCTSLSEVGEAGVGRSRLNPSDWSCCVSGLKRCDFTTTTPTRPMWSREGQRWHQTMLDIIGEFSNYTGKQPMRFEIMKVSFLQYVKYVGLHNVYNIMLSNKLVMRCDNQGNAANIIGILLHTAVCKYST